MNQNIMNNFNTFLQYTQRYYENMFKFVPLGETKSCFIKDHSNPNVGVWNQKKITYQDVMSQLSMLTRDVSGVGIHTSKDVVILDIDSIILDDNSKIKLTDKQKDYLINSFGTLAQKTNSGVHLYFKNDMNFEVASTGQTFNLHTSKLKYDIRGLGRAYVGIKELENSFTLNDLKNVSEVENIFKFDVREASKKRKYEIDDEKLKEFFADPTPEDYEKDLKKLYNLDNVLNGRTLKQLQDENYAEGNRYPTFTQIALRGAGIGVNYNVIEDVIVDMNKNLEEALNEKRLDGVFKVTDELINCYAKYEQQRTSIKQQNLLPNLRLKITKIDKSPFGTVYLLGYTTYKNSIGKQVYTNYKITIGELSPNVKEGDVVDFTVAQCEFKTEYERKGEMFQYKDPVYETLAVDYKVPKLTENNKPFGLSVQGLLVGETTSSDKYNYIVLKNDKDKFIKLRFNKNHNLIDYKNKIFTLPLSNFTSEKNLEGKYFSTGKLTQSVTKNINAYVSKNVSEVVQNTQQLQTSNSVVQEETQQVQNFNTNQIQQPENINYNYIPEPQPPMEEYYQNEPLPFNEPFINNNVTSDAQTTNNVKVAENLVKQPLRVQKPNLRMNISFVNEMSNFVSINGYTAKKDDSGKWHKTYYDINIPKTKNEIKPKDKIDITLNKLEYVKEFFNKKTGLVEQYATPRFIGSGYNAQIVNTTTPKKSMGAYISGTCKITNNQLQICNSNREPINVDKPGKYSNLDNIEVNIPITNFEIKNNEAKAFTRLTNQNISKFKTNTKQQKV